MAAYLDGELPAKTRRFMARQIDENSLCYQEYIRARQTKQTLERELPIFGPAEQGQLDHIWANIQSELQTKVSSPVVVNRSRYTWGYGLAVIMLAMILLAPFALDASRIHAATVPQHPLPELAATRTSPAQLTASSATSVAFAQDTEVQSTNDLSAQLQNTPEPGTPRQ
jgi:anti-sigma factor RsiW